ncbi:hypothetical protein LIER_43210 [Lithospermum erythrorhizon]|uniref:Uncharacterized protein n=1 Tax=Lithospermum erythrorhizon TaxID=34254 RepID=A0AAV3PN62_LITER
MVDSNHPRSSRLIGPSQVLQGTLKEGNINIDDHASIPMPTLESLQRRSTMSQTSDELVGSLLRDRPETTNAAGDSRADSPNVDDSQGPLDVMPLRSLMGPPEYVPVAQGSQVALLETSKGKRSKDPSQFRESKAKTIPDIVQRPLPQREDLGVIFELIGPWPVRLFTVKTLPRLKSEVEKLRAGFSVAFPHEVFCDRDDFTLQVQKGPKVPVPKATPTVSEAVIEAFGLPSPTTRDPVTIVIPDRVSPSLGKSPTSSSHPSPILPPSESASGSECPWLPTLYRLPSGVTVTEETISKMKSSTASLLMKNCMQRRMPDSVLLSLKWKEAEDSLVKLAADKFSLEGCLTEALALADDVENKYQDLLAVRDGIFQSKSDLTNQYETDIAALKMDVVIDNTVSIMKEYNSEVYPEFRGIHSLFPEFVEKTFGREYVVELTDSEDEDEESSSHGSGDDEAFEEDAPQEDAFVA